MFRLDTLLLAIGLAALLLGLVFAVVPLDAGALEGWAGAPAHAAPDATAGLR